MLLTGSAVQIDATTQATFGAAVNSASGVNNSLTVNAPTTVFTGPVGGVVGGMDALGTLTTDAAGTTQIAANITAADVQLNDAVEVTGSDATIMGTTSVALGSTVDSGGGTSNNLTVDSPSVTLGGAVGGAVPLNDFTLTTTGAATVDQQVTVANNVVLDAGGDLTIDETVSAGNQADVTSGGAITGGGSVGGSLVNLTAATGIDSDGAGGRFMTQAGALSVTTTGGDAAIENATALTLNDSSVTGSLTVFTTTGNLTDDVDTGVGEEIFVTGNAVFRTVENNAAIDLDGLNIQGGLEVSTNSPNGQTGADATIVNAGAIDFIGASDVDGHLNVTAGTGTIRNSGDIDSGSFTATARGAGGGIELDDNDPGSTNDDFGVSPGEISLDTVGDATVVTLGSMTLGQSTVDGTLDVTAVNNTLTNTAGLTAGNLAATANGTSGSISLSNLNVTDSIVVNTVGGASLDSGLNNVSMDSSTVGGALSVTTTEFTVNDGQTVTAGNAITVLAGEDSGAGGATIGTGATLATSATGSTVSVSSGTTSGDIVVHGTLAARDTGMNRTGTLTLTAPGGQITGSGTTVAETVRLTALTGVGDVGVSTFTTDAASMSLEVTGGGADITNLNTLELIGLTSSPGVGADVEGELVLTVGSGDIQFDVDVEAFDSAALNATQGAIQGQGTAVVESPDVTLNARDGIDNGAGGALNTETTSISATNSGTGDVLIANTHLSAVTVAGLTSQGGAITFEQAGGGPLTVAGNVTSSGGAITLDETGAGGLTVTSTLIDSGVAGGTGGDILIRSSDNGPGADDLNLDTDNVVIAPVAGGQTTIRTGLETDATSLGGDLTIEAGNELTFDTSGGAITLDTRSGTGGMLDLGPGVNQTGLTTRFVGMGTISLQGQGDGDLEINTPLMTEDAPIMISVPGDIIVEALIQTEIQSGNASDVNITLHADADGTDGGGVVIREGGSIDSAADVSIFGSDLIVGQVSGVGPVAGDGVVIADSSLGVIAAGGILIETADGANQSITLGADLTAGGVHSGLRLDETTPVDASIRVVSPVLLSGSPTVTTEAAGANNHVVFEGTIDADPDVIASDLDLTVAGNTGSEIRFEELVGGTSAFNSLTTQNADLDDSGAPDAGLTVTTVFSSDTNGPTVTPDPDPDTGIDRRTLETGTVTTTGSQRFNTAQIMLEADTGLMSTGSEGDITLGGAVTGTGGRSLDIAAGRDVTVNDITLGGGNLSLQANSGFNTNNSTNTEVPSGVITINSTLNSDGGNIILGAAGRGATVPTVATINGDDPTTATNTPGTTGVTILTDGGDFFMGPNEKFTVDGPLTIETEGGDAVLGDLNTRGNLTVDVTGGGGGQLIIRLREPVRNLLPNAGEGAPVVAAPIVDDGVDFVALGSSSRINLNTGTANPNILSIGSGNDPTFSVEGNPGARITLPAIFQRENGSTVSTNDLRGRPQSLDDITVGVNPTFFVDFQLGELVNIATSIASVASTQEGEDVSEEVLIAQTAREKLRQLGIFARDAEAEERVEALLDGAEVIVDVVPSDADASDHEVTTSRIHSGAATVALQIYSGLYWQAAIDEEGNPLLDEEGRPILEPQTEKIRQAFAQALEAYTDAGYTFEDPWEFRDYLESAAVTNEALAYANGLRQLFDQLRLIGITPKEMRIAKSILIAQSGITPAGMSWEQLDQAIEGRPTDLAAEDENPQPPVPEEEQPEEIQALGVPVLGGARALLETGR